VLARSVISRADRWLGRGRINPRVDTMGKPRVVRTVVASMCVNVSSSPSWHSCRQGDNRGRQYGATSTGRQRALPLLIDGRVEPTLRPSKPRCRPRSSFDQNQL